MILLEDDFVWSSTHINHFTTSAVQGLPHLVDLAADGSREHRDGWAQRYSRDGGPEWDGSLITMGWF